MDGLPVSVVGDAVKPSDRRVIAFQIVANNEFALLDELGGVVLVILGVIIPNYDMVAEVVHSSLASGVTRDERRAHVSRVTSNDRDQGLLKTVHLITAVCFG